MKKNDKKKIKRFIKTAGSFLAILGALFFGVIQLKQPSKHRDWEEEFSIQPTVTINNNLVTIHNIRDWKYTPTNIVARNYITKTFDVNKLEKVWFMLEPFGKWDGVAHTYFVFDFADQEPVSFSIEARRQKKEVYTAWEGLLRKYELIYLWGTESDFTVRRTVYLKNKVYMFPLLSTAEFQKQLFLELAKETDQLSQKPRFYNTITSNCTNNLAEHANKVKRGTVPLHYSRVLTGYAGQLLYDLGYIPNAQPYDEIKNMYYVNDVVDELYQDADFSKKLRERIHQKTL